MNVTVCGVTRLNILSLFGRYSIKLMSKADAGNILMEIPTYVVSPGASSTELVGDGWSLNKSKKEENSALSKLKDLF